MFEKQTVTPARFPEHHDCSPVPVFAPEHTVRREQLLHRLIPPDGGDKRLRLLLTAPAGVDLDTCYEAVVTALPTARYCGARLFVNPDKRHLRRTILPIPASVVRTMPWLALFAALLSTDDEQRRTVPCMPTR